VIKLIDDFKMAMELANYEPPISIEVGEKFAADMKRELRMMLKYSSNTGLAHNQALYKGILIVAPKNFSFVVEKISPDDWK